MRLGAVIGSVCKRKMVRFLHLEKVCQAIRANHKEIALLWEIYHLFRIIFSIQLTEGHVANTVIVCNTVYLG